MSQANYSDLRTERAAPDEVYAWRHVIFILGSVYVLIFAAYLFASCTDYPWAIAVVIPFLGAQIYKITIIMHDCCHYTLFGARAVNVWVGTICGWFVGADFKNFSRLHWKHHARYGEKDDPQGDDYLHLDTSSKGALLWHIVRPMFGYNLFKLFQFLSPRTERPDESVSVRRSGVKEKLLFLVGVGVVQLSIAAVATGLLHVWWLMLLYPLAAATFALFFSQTRGFAEHIAEQGQSPVRYARTHLPNFIDRLFFYTLNFNYHIEHHRYPSVPSCHLPRLHEEMSRESEFGDVSTSILGTVTRRWRNSRTAE
jgi:fatty acid desaturase